MKPNAIFILLLISLLPAFSLQANRQDTVRRQSGYADLDLYYSQLEKNTNKERLARERYLLETTPAESLIMAFIERGYDTYRDTIYLHLLYNHRYTPLTREGRHALVEEMYAAARKHKSEELKRLSDLFKATLMGNRDGQYEEKMEMFEKIIRSSRKAGDAVMEAEILQQMWLDSFYSNRYARASAYALRLTNALERAGEDYPHKAQGHFFIGMHYYSFQEEERALPHLHRADYMEAWNYLAVYHRKSNDLDSAAWYHRKILHEGTNDKAIYQAIAISNLGRIELDRGNTDAGIAMLKAGFDYMENHDPDRSFMMGIQISLGEVCLDKGDMAATLEHITAARNQLLPTDIAILQDRWQKLYALESSYYARLGQHDLAKAYRDSALMALTKHEQATGRHIILLGEQQLQEAEAELKDQRIGRQRNVILLAVAVLIFVSAALLVIVSLYRRRNAAYKKLAQKAQEWAKRDETVRLPATEAAITTAEDLRIMALSDREMTENHAYREAEITLDSLAARLNIRRNAFSGAINRVTGGNFNQYVNGYRIREAIHIISQTEQKLYIKELYERVGFTSRSTFSRTFKQFTGLSPLEFQRQKGDGLKIGEF